MRRLLALATIGSLLCAANVAAEADPTSTSLTPWGGQGEVMLASSASERDMQIAALLDERDRLSWVADAGGYPEVVAASPLDLGVVNDAVEALRFRLTLSNDLPEALNWPAGSLEARTYDFDMLQAVQRFQLRNHIEATGIVDARTLSVLNLPVDFWITQIDTRLCEWDVSPSQVNDTAPPAVKGVVVFSESISDTPACADSATSVQAVYLVDSTDAN